MQVSSNGSSPQRKRRWLPFIMGTKVHYHYVWLKGLSKDLMMFEAESANQMYHWSRTICSYKTDIEESWVPSCPILICVGEKTQWVWFYVSFIPLVERHCSIAPEFLKVLSLPKKQELCEFDCYVWDLRQLHDRHLKVKQKLPNELVFGYSHKVPEPWADF
jgi:hypothetical protein